MSDRIIVDADYPRWKSSLVALSLWTDPEYVAYRLRRLARRVVRTPLPRAAHGADVPESGGWGGGGVPEPRLDGLEVDLVYTWVDGGDPGHRARREEWLARSGLQPAVANPDARYVDHGELRYSLRSAELFLPWIRRVFIVTDAQVPPWLDVRHPRVKVVDHRDIATDIEDLPTFNSKAIFSWLVNIPGLAEHFVVADDDTFFGQPCHAGDFFGRGARAGDVTMKVMPSTSESGWIVPARQLKDDPLARIWMAGWNNTKLLLERRRPWRRVRRIDLHQAYGITRSAMRLTEERYPVEYRRVRSSRFRATSDVHLSALVRYGALFDGRAVRGALPSRVFSREEELRELGASDLPELFCINGGGGSGHMDPGVPRDLERLFPRPSSFELPDHAPDGNHVMPGGA